MTTMKDWIQSNGEIYADNDEKEGGPELPVEGEDCYRKIRNCNRLSRLSMTSHLHGRRRAAIVAMWREVWWRRHHHRICVLHCRHCEHFTTVRIKGHHTLRTLMIVWMGMRRNRRWGHGWSWTSAVGWRWVRARRRLHVCLRSY